MYSWDEPIIIEPYTFDHDKDTYMYIMGKVCVACRSLCLFHPFFKDPCMCTMHSM